MQKDFFRVYTPLSKHVGVAAIWGSVQKSSPGFAWLTGRKDTHTQEK